MRELLEAGIVSALPTHGAPHGGVVTAAVLFTLLAGCAHSTAEPTGSVAEGAPEFGPPLVSVAHNQVYIYPLQVTDPEGEEVTIEVVQRPAWLDYDVASSTLAGTAGWENVGLHPVQIRATDGVHTSWQKFSIEVTKGTIICNQDFGDPDASEFTLPYPEGRTYVIIQGYCPPNPNWGHHNWFAYDFDLTTGDTVLASRGGHVLFVRENQPDIGGRCGVNGENMVIVRHDDGTVMHYVHLTTNGALVQAGDQVEQGEPIGLSGNSGCSSGPHLHVALFRDSSDLSGKATLPFNYRNGIGPLDANRGLKQGEEYLAGPHPGA